MVVVGAGLAGLNAARTLRKAGLSPVILEASDGVGGRVRTDVVDGFLLDRGFQIYLTGVTKTNTPSCRLCMMDAQLVPSKWPPD